MSMVLSSKPFLPRYEISAFIPRKIERTLSNKHLKVPSYKELARHDCGNNG